MGSIPLPELEGRQAAPPSALNAVAQMEAIKNAQQERQVRDLAIQQQQIQLKDQQAMTQAMQEWDGNDWNQMPLLIRKHGGSANAIIGMQNQILQRQRDLATLSKDQLANEATKHDQVVGALSPLTDPKQVADADLPNAIRSTAQDLMKRGLLDQQHEQTAEQLANLDPATARAQLSMFSKGLMGEKAQVENAAKQAETQKNTASAVESQAKTEEAKANTAKTQKETQLMQQYGFSSPAQLEMKFLSEDMKRRQGQPYDSNFVAAYKGMKTLVPVANFNLQNAGMTGGGSGRPSAIAQSLANGQMKWQDVVSARTPASVKEALLNEVKSINPNFNSGDFSIEQDVKKYMTSGKGGQQLTAFNTAIAHLDLLDKLADDLHNTNLQVLNKAKQAWATQTGNPAPANFEAAKNAMSGEVAAALKASGATDEEIANVGGTFSRAQSPAQLRGAINTYRTLLKSKAGNLKAQYEQGLQAQPNFGEENAPKGGAMKITLPSGKQITIE